MLGYDTARPVQDADCGIPERGRGEAVVSCHVKFLRRTDVDGRDGSPSARPSAASACTCDLTTRSMAMQMATLVRRAPRGYVRALCTLEDELGLRRRSIGRKMRGDGPRRVDGLQQRELPEPEPPDESGPIARLATAPLKPRTADALVADYETKARALYETCPGFLGALLLFDGPKRNARSIVRSARVSNPVGETRVCVATADASFDVAACTDCVGVQGRHGRCAVARRIRRHDEGLGEPLCRRSRRRDVARRREPLCGASCAGRRGAARRFGGVASE